LRASDNTPNYRLLPRTRDNIVASFVDVASLFVAYRIGVEQLGPIAGVGYGIFDAWIVIWQRERIALYVRKSAYFIKKSGKLFAKKKAVAPLPWITT
jgi:hypothetical protein